MFVPVMAAWFCLKVKQLSRDTFLRLTGVGDDARMAEPRIAPDPAACTQSGEREGARSPRQSQAARTVARKCATSAPRCSDWRDSSSAALSTWAAAAPVSSEASATPVMLLVTSAVPVAA